MSAAPAYSYYPERIERIPERAPRERISVMPGRGPRTQAPALPASVVFLAKALAAVLLVVAVVGVVRIGFTAATVTTSMQSQELSSQIEQARASGADLEVSQSLMASPARVKQEAEALKMSEPASVGTIELEQDVVATDAEGDLSLSGSVARAAAGA
ncbi:cell division protein FtsL [Arabiibacter massiliensis]|uniref:cell division protein FtsL n=1 Tax=Arabiibacter massiliensis TaxID=1870985 RepID=UPI0009BB8783|nr:cell division protein FtsL [Arabiibacter massiliensis]